MNNIIGPERTRLGKDSMNDLLEIQINGPELEDFCEDAALQQLNEKGKGYRHINGHSRHSN